MLYPKPRSQPVIRPVGLKRAINANARGTPAKFEATPQNVIKLERMKRGKPPWTYGAGVGTSTPTVVIQPSPINFRAAESWSGLGETAAEKALEEGNLALRSAGIAPRDSKSACCTP